MYEEPKNSRLRVPLAASGFAAEGTGLNSGGAAAAAAAFEFSLALTLEITQDYKKAGLVEVTMQEPS